MKVFKSFIVLIALIMISFSFKSYGFSTDLKSIIDLREEILSIENDGEFTAVLTELNTTSRQFSAFLRKKLNGGDPLTGHDQAIAIQLIYSYHHAFLRAPKTEANAQEKFKTIELLHSEIFTHKQLRRILKSTFKTQMAKNKALKAHFKSLKPMTKKFKSYSFSDGFIRLLDKTMHHVSGAFGNFAGFIRWRKGNMYKRPDLTVQIIDRLRPLDIVLERTPFALTDTFIPGNFGHAALYMGTKEELIELGIWDQDFMAPFRKDIEEGKTILEAIRPGTNLKTVAKFLKVDEMLVIRQENILDNFDLIKQIYKTGVDQIGKNYDFNFDVNSNDTVVCSELIYHAFGHVKWPTKYILGRHTISPDQIADLVFYKNTPIDFDIYYYAKNKQDLTYWSIKTLADKLSFIQSKDDEDIFLRKKKVCRDVVRKVRRGKRTVNQKRRICTKKLIHLEYVAPTVYEL